MRIFTPKNDKVKSIIKPIDEKIIQQLVSNCLKIKKDDETATIYSRFYETQYSAPNLANSENALLSYLQSILISNANCRVKEQGKEYIWVIINENTIGATAYRFYFAPNPSNMHDIVKKLTEEFVQKGISVKFKYQLGGKMDECDRIIIYSDFENKDSIESSLATVYRANPQLFEGSEKALPWIYESQTPNIYLAPETPGSSYGEEFARTMIQAKEIFCYMYGITDKNNKINLSGNNAKQALDYMELIVTSLLFRNGLLLSKDEKKITFKDNIKTIYDYKTGMLTNYCNNPEGFHTVTFSQNNDSKNAFLTNFYNVSRILPQKGITVEHLTPEERRRKLNETLYKDVYSEKQKNNQQSNSLGK